MDCNKPYEKKFEDLFKRFQSTCKFCDGDIYKFYFRLQKVVYPYEYIVDCERFNETSLPQKKEIYNNLTVESITDADYKYDKTAWEDFGIHDLGHYHDLYVQSYTLLLADVFESLRNKCLEIY